MVKIKAINSSKAMVTIDGRDYISLELAEKLIGESETLSINDGVASIGKVISDKANLFDQWNVNYESCEIVDSITDSYGNVHTNSLNFGSQKKGSAVYNLNNKYSLLKVTISMNHYAESDRSGIITIKADDQLVYTSPTMNKTTKPLTVSDIPINNSSLLSIEYNGDYYTYFIISDAIVYN